MGREEEEEEEEDLSDKMLFIVFPITWMDCPTDLPTE